MARSGRDEDREVEPPDELLRRLRVSLVRRATLTLDGREEPVMLVDVGLRGVFVERAAGLPLDGVLSLRFELPGNARPIVVRGRVAWRQGAELPKVSPRLPAGAGVEFTHISDADRERLRAFLLERYRRHPRERCFTRAWPEERE